MAILKIKNENGEFINIPSIVGPKGESGPSNYNELTNIPIRNLTGTKTNPIILRNLNVGLYLITGYLKYHSNSNLYAKNFPILFLIPERNNNYSKCITFESTSYDKNVCLFYQISDNSFSSGTISNVGNINSLTTTDKTSVVNAINELTARIEALENK